MTKHDWILDNMISMIAYTQKEGLTEKSKVLLNALHDMAMLQNCPASVPERTLQLVQNPKGSGLLPSSRS